MKLREGDTVMVISGKDAGTESKIARVYPGQEQNHRRGRCDSKAKPEADRRAQHRRNHRQGHADQRFERDDRLQGLWPDEDRRPFRR